MSDFDRTDTLSIMRDDDGALICAAMRSPQHGMWTATAVRGTHAVSVIKCQSRDQAERIAMRLFSGLAQCQ